MDLGEFANVRTRLQRLSDAKFFSGWAHELNEEILRMRLSTSVQIEIGDLFMAEVHGPTNIALFRASIAIFSGTEATFNVFAPFKFMPSTENVRLSVEGMRGTAIYDGMRVPFEVLDVSPTGTGLLSRQSLPRSSIVDLELDTAFGVVGASGEVRYCRPDTEVIGSFRIGIRLKELGRLERARWNRLFTEAA